MRLLMTTDTIGGVWTFTRELAAGLLARGDEVVLVSFGTLPSRDQQEAADALTDNGRFRYFSEDVCLEWMQANKTAYTAGESLLLQLCSEFKPEALLLSQFCFGALPVSVPKVVIAHSDVLSWAIAVDKAPLPEDEWLQSYRKLVQSGLDGADMLVAPTKAALDAMRLHFRVPCRTEIVPNGRSLPNGTGSLPKTLRAVSAGRMWDPAKNLALLTKVKTAMPLVVAGESDPAGSWIGDVAILGPKTEFQLLQLFSQSAIYVCSSTYEPFGLAPLEAALCGCAVVVNDIPSLREVWADAAMYFTNAETLAEALKALAADEALLKTVQSSSMCRAQSFTVERMASAYRKHIEALVGAAMENETCAA